MGLFKSKYEKELDSLISGINMNMANNYKDNAQSDFLEYEKTLSRFLEQGVLKEKAKNYYEIQLGSYRERLKGYSHKDQKPYWTKTEE